MPERRLGSSSAKPPRRPPPDHGSVVRAEGRPRGGGAAQRLWQCGGSGARVQRGLGERGGGSGGGGGRAPLLGAAIGRVFFLSFRLRVECARLLAELSEWVIGIWFSEATVLYL